MLLLAVICGGASGVLTFTVFKAGLVATPSPGSILCFAGHDPERRLYCGNVRCAGFTVVSFLVASVFVKRAAEKMDEGQLDEAKENEGIKRCFYGCCKENH